MCIVAFADTVVDPWAVMVISINAYTTKCAMSASWSSDHFAVWAETACLHCVQEFDKVELWVLLNRARIR